MEETKKETYESPQIKSEEMQIAQTMGNVCNGSNAGGRKDTTGAGCTTLLT